MQTKSLICLSFETETSVALNILCELDSICSIESPAEMAVEQLQHSSSAAAAQLANVLDITDAQAQVLLLEADGDLSRAVQMRLDQQAVLSNGGATPQISPPPPPRQTVHRPLPARPLPMPAGQPSQSIPPQTSASQALPIPEAAQRRLQGFIGRARTVAEGLVVEGAAVLQRAKSSLPTALAGVRTPGCAPPAAAGQATTESDGINADAYTQHADTPYTYDMNDLTPGGIVAANGGRRVPHAIGNSAPAGEARPGGHLVPAEASTTPRQCASIICNLTNQHRAQQGLPEVSFSPQLHQAAQNRVNDMLHRQYFSHDTPEGRPFTDAVREADFRYSTIAENIAQQYGSSGRYGGGGGFGWMQMMSKSSAAASASDPDRSIAAAFFEQWRSSPGHNANMLGRHTMIGVAIASGSFQGSQAALAVMILGTPMSSTTSGAGSSGMGGWMFGIRGPFQSPLPPTFMRVPASARPAPPSLAGMTTDVDRRRYQHPGDDQAAALATTAHATTASSSRPLDAVRPRVSSMIAELQGAIGRVATRTTMTTGGGNSSRAV